MTVYWTSICIAYGVVLFCFGFGRIFSLCWFWSLSSIFKFYFIFLNILLFFPVKVWPFSFCFFFKNFYLFIYFWLCWVFVSVRGPSPVAASGGHSSSRCAGLSLSRPLLLWSTGSRRAGSAAVAHGPSGSAACGIFPDQGMNPCPLHWQADSQPLRHQGSPWPFSFKFLSYLELTVDSRSNFIIFPCGY